MIKSTEVRAKAQKVEEQNYKFRMFLKNRVDDDELDAQFSELHRELFAGYDCYKCSNCCKSHSIILDKDEVKRISAFLGLTESAFIGEYLMNANTEDEKPYRFKAVPCAFLSDDGRCRIQDYKPDVCTGFPYTDQPDRLSSMYGIIGNAEVCPVVFEILERLKVIYGFRNRA